MTDFSASDAALEGFRLARRRPKVVLAWAAAHAIAGFASALVFIGIGSEWRDKLEAAGASEEASAAEAVATLVELLPVYAVLIPLALSLAAVMSAAVYRALLTPEEGRFAYLRFGADELRIIALTLVRILLAIVFVSALLFAGGIVTSLSFGFGGEAAAGLVGAVAGLAVLAAMAWVYVRLSLAPVITFAERRISVFHSWGVTRGRFWPLLGAYLLAFFAYLTILAVLLALAAMGVLIYTRGDFEAMSAVFNPSYYDVESYFTVSTIVYSLFSAVLNAIYYCVLYAPGAMAYTAFKGDSPAPTAPSADAAPVAV